MRRTRRIPAFHSTVRLEQFAKEADLTLTAEASKKLEQDARDLVNALKEFVRAVPKA